MKIKIYIITLLLSAVLGSCSSSFLDEKPLDFMSATNSFLTQEDIDCSVNNLYYLVRREFYSRDENRPMDYLYGTDIVYDGEPNGTEPVSYTHLDVYKRQEDDRLTEHLDKAAKVMNIRLIDHVILTDGKFYSYADEGKI